MGCRKFIWTNSEYMQPTGIPLNLGWGGGMPKVGMIADDALFDDIHNDVSNNFEGKTTITENDKAYSVIWVYERACLRV